VGCEDGERKVNIINVIDVLDRSSILGHTPQIVLQSIKVGF
jgi:hypothetical protein